MDIIGERSMADLLDEQMRAHGPRVCLVHETQEGVVTQLTFQEMREASIGLAAAFQSIGLAKGDRAFVFLRNTADFVPTWFGLMYAGAIVVPGNIYLTVPEVRFLVSDSAPRIVITEQKFLPLIKAASNELENPPVVLVMDGEGDGDGETIAISSLTRDMASFTPVPLSSDDLAEILYTSGTSSRPKGVMHTHANLLWCGLSGDGLGPNDRFFNNKPLFHANCQSTVLTCLTAGATAIIGERYSATRYIAQLIRHQVTICSLSGMLCRTLLNQPPSPYDKAHSVRLGRYAINISQGEIDAFVERFRIPLKNGYGLSESMLSVTSEPRNGPPTYPSIGRPAMEREIFIVDENNQPLPTGHVGEIVVRGRPGRNLMLGYYRNEEATRAAFEGGWLHTGDLGSMDERGNFYFFGRKKEVIKRSGENISASEVEEVLINHPAVRDVAVIGVPDPVRDQAVKAFIVLNDVSATAEALREYCRTRLAYFKVPEFVVFVDALPRNASGKIMKRELEAR